MSVEAYWTRTVIAVLIGFVIIQQIALDQQTNSLQHLRDANMALLHTQTASTEALTNASTELASSRTALAQCMGGRSVTLKVLVP